MISSVAVTRRSIRGGRYSIAVDGDAVEVELWVMMDWRRWVGKRRVGESQSHREHERRTQARARTSEVSVRQTVETVKAVRQKHSKKPSTRTDTRGIFVFIILHQIRRQRSPDRSCLLIYVFESFHTRRRCPDGLWLNKVDFARLSACGLGPDWHVTDPRSLSLRSKFTVPTEVSAMRCRRFSKVQEGAFGCEIVSNQKFVLSTSHSLRLYSIQSTTADMTTTLTQMRVSTAT